MEKHLPDQSATSQPSPPTRDQHPLEQTLELLSKTSLSEQDWIDAAWKDYRVRNGWGSLFSVLIEASCLVALFTLSMLWVLLHSDPHTSFPRWIDQAGLVVLGTALMIGMSSFILFVWKNGHRLGTADERWLVDGYGMRVLEEEFSKHFVFLREHIRTRLSLHQTQWESLRSTNRNSPSVSLYAQATKLLELLEHQEQALRLTHSSRWLRGYESPHSMGTRSRERFATGITNLRVLANKLNALKNSPEFFNLSPTLSSDDSSNVIRLMIEFDDALRKANENKRV